MSEPTFDSAMSQVDEVGEQLAALRAGARSAGFDIAPQRAALLAVADPIDPTKNGEPPRG